MRSEQIIFDDLANLCSLPGYVHAIAYLCFRDNVIRYSGEMKSQDMQPLFSKTRLIRTETSTLIGLLLKNDIDYNLPGPDVMQEYITRTEALLEEMHQSMAAPFLAMLTLNRTAEGKDFNPFANGVALREPIFYGGESAYSFQYRDFPTRKYANDEEWLRAKKGFSIQEARDVAYAVGRFRDEKSMKTIKEMRTKPPDQSTFLPGYTFTAEEIATYAGLDISTVKKVLMAFTVPDGEKNEQFRAMHDFNVANAFPLIQAEENTYILFHIYSLVEALYESPFYWMCADKAYVNKAMRHRGLFTEEFSFERLVHVFGKDRVYSNVDILASDGSKISEIDVLVLFGNRAIVLQAKSKRLTIESRKGNDLQIKDDFKKSVQESCDQAYKCAKSLGDSDYTLKDGHSTKIATPMGLKDVYILCVVSDHYPALSFQTHQFLDFEATSVLSPPFVLDVFTLDAMTEMLDSPLQLLSYVDRRTKYSERLMASHELIILSYHLQRNLWLGEEYSGMMFEDDISSDLDLAMLVRRDGIPGKSTPDGILTKFASTTLGCLVKDIEARPDSKTIDLGYMLLTLGEKTVYDVSNGIDELAKRARIDRKLHDLTIDLGPGGTGLTIHCSSEPIEIAAPTLERHCHARKYTQRAQTWFGVCLRPTDRSLRFGVNLDYQWERDDEMDTLTQNMGKPGSLVDVLKASLAKQRKIGRNEPCPCDSGKKYKKCCGR